MLTKQINYAHGKNPLPEFKACQRHDEYTTELEELYGEIVEGTQQIFIGCNFSQTIPHTVIGADGVIFRNCNIHNCDTASGVILENCSQVGRFYTWCSHENDFKDIQQCAEDCEHSEEHTLIEDDIETVFYTYVDRIEVP